MLTLFFAEMSEARNGRGVAAPLSQLERKKDKRKNEMTKERARDTVKYTNKCRCMYI